MLPGIYNDFGILPGIIHQAHRYNGLLQRLGIFVCLNGNEVGEGWELFASRLISIW
jgi:hypothetical protein